MNLNNTKGKINTKLSVSNGFLFTQAKLFKSKFTSKKQLYTSYVIPVLHKAPKKAMRKAQESEWSNDLCIITKYRSDK